MIKYSNVIFRLLFHEFFCLHTVTGIKSCMSKMCLIWGSYVGQSSDLVGSRVHGSCVLYLTEIHTVGRHLALRFPPSIWKGLVKWGNVFAYINIQLGAPLFFHTFFNIFPERLRAWQEEVHLNTLQCPVDPHWDSVNITAVIETQ